MFCLSKLVPYWHIKRVGGPNFGLSVHIVLYFMYKSSEGSGDAGLHLDSLLVMRYLPIHYILTHIHVYFIAIYYSSTSKFCKQTCCSLDKK